LNSSTRHQLYNLGRDPWELNNYLGKNGKSASDAIVGKAEHLKILLLQWMSKRDGKARYYSDGKYNGDGMRSLMAEVADRRTWRKVNFWKSDTVLSFGPVSSVVGGEGGFTRTEYLFMGRTTTKGSVNIQSISVKGQDARFFKVDTRRGIVKGGDHLQARVTFTSRTRSSLRGIKAYVEVRNSVTGVEKIPIRGV